MCFIVPIFIIPIGSYLYIATNPPRIHFLIKHKFMSDQNTKSVSKTKLFEVIFSPKSLGAFALPNRILKEFPDGRVECNYLFYGDSGLGKSALAKFLGNDFNLFVLDASLEGSINSLRKGSDLFAFCTTTNMLDNRPKMILFDEINGVSKAFWEGVKGFTDLIKPLNILYIATTNHISEIDSAMKSRMRLISFNYMESEENEKHLLYKNRAKLILDKIKCTYENESVLDEFIKNSGYDWRTLLQNLQYLHRAGETSLTEENINKQTFEYNSLYDLICNGDIKEVKKNVELINTFSNPNAVVRGVEENLFKWIETNCPAKIKYIPSMVITICRYNYNLTQRVDPVIVSKAMIYELMMICSKP
jgi:DNA polymerase III delta prime subunit